MSDALKSGAKMVAEICPVCSSPLFEIDSELTCMRCGKRVVKVREDSEVAAASLPYILSQLKIVLTGKVEELTLLLSRASDLEKVQQLTQVLERVLGVIKQVRELEATRRS